MRFLQIPVLLFFLNASCANAGMSLEIDSTCIKGSASDKARAAVFDGNNLSKVEVPVSGFKFPHGITEKYSGVVFLMRDGFYPKQVLFKSSKKPELTNIGSWQKIDNEKTGVLTGIVFMPVTGGKLSDHTGIVKVYKDVQIRVKKGSFFRTAVTDSNGFFMIQLEEGEYTITTEGMDSDKISIEKNRTTIKNIQKGMVLMD